MTTGDVLAVHRIEKATRRADRASRRLKRAMDRRSTRSPPTQPSPHAVHRMLGEVADVSRWTPEWDLGDSADESDRERLWLVEAALKKRLGRVRTDDGRRCVFASSVDGARVGVFVARRSAAVPVTFDAVRSAIAGELLDGQVSLVSVPHPLPRQLLFEFLVEVDFPAAMGGDVVAFEGALTLGAAEFELSGLVELAATMAPLLTLAETFGPCSPAWV